MSLLFQAMYSAYVRSCQHTSCKTHESLTFMRLTLSELYNLDHKLIYHHAHAYVGALQAQLTQAAASCKQVTILNMC